MKKLILPSFLITLLAGCSQQNNFSYICTAYYGDETLNINIDKKELESVTKNNRMVSQLGRVTSKYFVVDDVFFLDRKTLISYYTPTETNSEGKVVSKPFKMSELPNYEIEEDIWHTCKENSIS